MFAHLLWAAVVVYTVHTVATLVREGRPAAAQEQVLEVPQDLIAYAMSFSETWAQEDAMRAIQQSYEQWKDWNRVRAAMGIGRMD